MIDFLVKEIKEKASLCDTYIATSKNMSDKLADDLYSPDNNFGVKARKGEYSLAEYIELKKNFYLSNLVREDLAKHLMATGALYEVLLTTLKSQNKNIEDYLSKNELDFIKSAVAASECVTAKVNNQIVFKNSEIEQTIYNKLEQQAPEEYQKMLEKE